MTNTTKATLLSGLIFPGLGQFLILKRPKRGALFLLPALAAVAWLMNALSASTSELFTEAASGRLASGLLFGLQPSDPATMGMAAALLAAVAIVAAYLPAWRASRVDPVVALRSE